MPTGVLNILAQSVLPQVFGSLNDAGLVDTMDVLGETKSAGPGGGRVKSAAPVVYNDVPVSYEPAGSAKRLSAGDQIVSSEQYLLTFPTHMSDGATRINLDPTVHRLSVNARGNEPVKVFRIVAIGDVSGVVYEVVCEREN